MAGRLPSGPSRAVLVARALLIALPAVGPVAAPMRPPSPRRRRRPSAARSTAPDAPPRPAATSVAVGPGGPWPPGHHRALHRDAQGRRGHDGRRRQGPPSATAFTPTEVRQGLKGFAAKLDAQPEARPRRPIPNVLAVVPDEVIQITAQIDPDRRVADRRPAERRQPRTRRARDDRVDADVAIVDTGIAKSPGPNVAGGYNCSTTDRSAWRDKNNHGTHVAGTVGGARQRLRRRRRRARRPVWGVKILNDDGYGLLSWYVCGLDWVLAQSDPNDATRPLFEAVNMSVTKPGPTTTTAAIPTRTSCTRRSAGSSRAASRSSPRRPTTPQRRAEHPGELQRGDHGLGPCGHGRQGRRPRRQSVLLVGRLRQGRHVRRLQQLRRRRRHHRPGQVHLVHDPGSRLRVPVGHVDGGPGGHRRRRAVQGQPAEGDPGRGQGGAPLSRQLQLEDVDRPGLDPRAAARRLDDLGAR